MWPVNGWAQSDVRPLVTLERTSDALQMSARLPLELTPAQEDVLYKGVPLHFVWQADVMRSRWYWWDERVASLTRVVRLVYQPLTRRWRVGVDSGPPGENGGLSPLHQNLDNLTDALATVSRVSSWRLVDAGKLPPGYNYRVEFRFYLDAGMLPRPFQIGLRGQNDWGQSFEQVLPVPAQASPGADAGPMMQMAGG